MSKTEEILSKELKNIKAQLKEDIVLQENYNLFLNKNLLLDVDESKDKFALFWVNRMPKRADSKLYDNLLNYYIDIIQKNIKKLEEIKKDFYIKMNENGFYKENIKQIRRNKISYTFGVNEFEETDEEDKEIQKELSLEYHEYKRSFFEKLFPIFMDFFYAFSNCEMNGITDKEEVLSEFINYIFETKSSCTKEKFNKLDSHEVYCGNYKVEEEEEEE